MTTSERQPIHAYKTQRRQLTRLQTSLHSDLSELQRVDVKRQIEQTQNRLRDLAHAAPVRDYFKHQIQNLDFLKKSFQHYQNPAFMDGHITRDEFEKKRKRLVTFNTSQETRRAKEYIRLYPEMGNERPIERPSGKPTTSDVYVLPDGRTVRGIRAKILKLVSERGPEDAITMRELATIVYGADLDNHAARRSIHAHISAMTKVYGELPITQVFLTGDGGPNEKALYSKNERS